MSLFSARQTNIANPNAFSFSTHLAADKVKSNAMDMMPSGFWNMSRF